MDCSKVDGLKFECGGPDEERCVKTEILIFERLQPHTRVDLKGMNGLRRIQVSNGAAVCDMFESRKILHLTIEGKEDVCNEKSIPTRQTKRSEQTTTGEIMSDRVSGGAKTETTSTNKPSIVIKEAFHLNTYIIIVIATAGLFLLISTLVIVRCLRRRCARQRRPTDQIRMSHLRQIETSAELSSASLNLD